MGIGRGKNCEFGRGNTSGGWEGQGNGGAGIEVGTEKN